MLCSPLRMMWRVWMLNGHLSEAAKGVRGGRRTPFRGRKWCPKMNPNSSLAEKAPTQTPFRCCERCLRGRRTPFRGRERCPTFGQSIPFRVTVCRPHHVVSYSLPGKLAGCCAPPTSLDGIMDEWPPCKLAGCRALLTLLGSL